MRITESVPQPRGVEAITTALGIMSPGAVVFDCDGVLLDTQSVWNRAQEELLEDRGARMEAADAAYLVGRSVEDVVVAVARAVGEDPYAVGHELGERHKALLAGGIPVFEGARELLAAASESVPVAVASNSPRRFLIEGLRATGFLELVDHVVAIDDVAEGKPAPDIYLHAAAALGAAPHETLAVEDSETGARAARAAGLKLLTIPTIAGQDPVGDHRLASIADPSLLAWARSWPRSRTTVPTQKETSTP
ncbi:MAG: HAD family phosphatase [Dermabacter sp.]|nr:HAD family phosphatase [Dermabacter sp.]